MNSPDPTVGRWNRPANAAPLAFAAALGLLLVTACTTPSPAIVAPPDDTPPDTTPPGISLGHSHTTVLTPLTLTLTVVANDDTGVVRVAFFRLDDSGASPTPIGEASTAPYILELPLTARDNGVIRFVARAFDAAGNVGESDEVSVTVAIPFEGAPVFASSPVTDAEVGRPYRYEVRAVAADPGDAPALAAERAPAWLEFTDNGDGTGLLAGTPEGGDAGEHRIELRATDGTGASDEQVFTLTVAPAVSDPGAPGIDPTIDDVPGDQTVLRNALDPTRVSVKFTVRGAGANPVVSARSSNPEVVTDSDLVPSCAGETCTLDFTPSPDRTASATITLNVAGASAAFDVALVPRWVSNAADSGSGSLREVIDEADPGDAIGFAPASAPSTIALTSEIRISKTLTIEGPGRDLLTLSGGGAVRPLKVRGGARATVRDLTLANGRAPELDEDASFGGCAIVLEGSELIAADVRFVECAAGFGGALYLVSANATLRDVDLEDNGALAGGAIYNDGTLVLDGVRVTDNRALGDGGGIYNGGALVVRSSSVVEGNRADAGGAGVGRGGGLFQEVGASTEGLGALTIGGNLPDDIHVEP